MKKQRLLIPNKFFNEISYDTLNMVYIVKLVNKWIRNA